MDARNVISGLRLQRGDAVVTIKNGTFSWSKKSVSPTLEDVDLTVRMGELVGIMGKVGAGKVSVKFPALDIALLIQNLSRAFCRQLLVICTEKKARSF